MHHNRVSNLLCTFLIAFPSLCSSTTLRWRTSSNSFFLQLALCSPCWVSAINTEANTCF